MKSVGISAKPNGTCLEVMRLPVNGAWNIPPVPAGSNCPIALPAYTANSSGRTRARSSSHSTPTERTASEAPNTVSWSPRGWLREGYRLAGSKPVGAWPAEVTREAWRSGNNTSAPPAAHTSASPSGNARTCQPAGKRSGKRRRGITNLRPSPPAARIVAARWHATSAGSKHSMRRMRVWSRMCWRVAAAAGSFASPINAARLAYVSPAADSPSASMTMRRKA